MKKKLMISFVFLFFIFGLASCDFFNGGNTTQPITQTTTQIEETTQPPQTTEDELTVQLKYIYDLAVREASFSGTYEEWLETVTGPEGAPGADGREIELQADGGVLQWRYTGTTTWTDLFDVSTLEGEDGQEATFQVSGTLLQWKYVGESSWTTLLDFANFVPDIQAVKDITINELFEIVVTYLDDTEVVLGTLTPDYVVIFRGFNGFIVDIQTVEEGSSAIEPMLLPIPGYTFTGWDKTFNQITENLMVNAFYEINEYTITFEENGGSEVADLTDVAFGTMVELPEPTKDNAVFIGWFYGDSPNDGQFTNQTPVTNDVTLYARYIDDFLTFTVSFYGKDGTLLTTHEVEAGGSVAAPMPPMVEGYVFTGWSADLSLITSDLDVYALYEVDMGDSYVITYELYGGTNSDDNPEVYYTNSGILSLETPMFDDYTFLGWYDNPGFEGMALTEIDTTNLVGEFNLYARWDVPTGTVVISFESNGGSFVEPLTIPLNQAVTITVIPTNEGYSFGGWFFDQGLTEPIFDDYTVISNMTLYAKWIPLTGDYYTVYYNYIDQNGTNVNDVLFPGEYVIDSYMGMMNQMVVTNMRVLAWGVNDYGQNGVGYSSPSVSSIETVFPLSDLDEGEIISNIQLGLIHTLFLTTNGRVFACGDGYYGQLGNGDINIQEAPIDVTDFLGLQEGEHIVDIAAGIQTSYFLTSNHRVIVAGLNYFGELGTGDTTPVMTPTDVTGNMPLNEGEYIIEVSASYDHVIYLTNEGSVYTCGGNAAGQLGNATTTPSSVPQDITLSLGLGVDEGVQNIYAGMFTSNITTTEGRLIIWGKDFTQAIMGPDGVEFVFQTTPLDITSLFGLQENELIIEASTGFFGGIVLTTEGTVFAWGDNNNGHIGDYTFEFSSIPQNITPYFELKEQENILTVKFFYGTASALTNSGCLYSWGYNDAAQVGNGDTEDVNYPLMVLAPGFGMYVELVAEVQYNPGDDIAPYTLLDVPGYNFDGWYLDELMTMPYVLGTMPESDLVLYGTYLLDTYSISYQNVYDADNSMNPTTYTIESETIYLSQISQDNLVFLGWYDNPDFSGDPITSIPQGMFGDLTFYAKWTAETPTTYTVTFETNGGSSIDPITLNIDEPLYIADEPTKEGFIFAGYWLDPDFSVSYEPGIAHNANITIYVNWEEQTPMYNVSFFVLQESGGLADVLGMGETIVDVYTNGFTSLAITSNFRILTVGKNDYGQCGEGTTTNLTTPVDITIQFDFASDEFVQSVAMGARHIVLLTTEGRVFVWGSNIYGAMGLGYNNSTAITEPLEITNRISLNPDEYLIKVEAGEGSSYALTNQHRVFAWGYNRNNIFGYPDTSTPYVLSPTDITDHFPTTELITDISAKNYHLVAITLFGTVLTSGDAGFDSLGTGSTSYYNTPTVINNNLPLETDEYVYGVKATYYYIILYTSNNRVLVLGDNGYTHLGSTTDPLGIYDFTATLPLGPDEFVLDTEGSLATLLVLTSEGRFLVVGENNDAECTIESGEWYSEPIDITAKVNPSGYIVTKLAAGYSNFMVVLNSGEIIGWGNYSYAQIFSGAVGNTYIPFTTLQVTKFIEIETALYYEGEQVLSYTPTLNGHVFDGWYIDEAMSIPYAYDLMPGYDIILYGRFTSST